MTVKWPAKYIEARRIVISRKHHREWLESGRGDAR